MLLSAETCIYIISAEPLSASTRSPRTSSLRAAIFPGALQSSIHLTALSKA